MKIPSLGWAVINPARGISPAGSLACLDRDRRFVTIIVFDLLTYVVLFWTKELDMVSVREMVMDKASDREMVSGKVLDDGVRHGVGQGDG